MTPRFPEYPWRETEENVFEWILQKAQDVRDERKVDRLLTKIKQKPHVPAAKVPPRD